MSEIDGTNGAPPADSAAPVVTFKKRGGAKRKEFRAPAASLAARTDAQLLAAAPVAAEPATNDVAAAHGHATNATASDATTASTSEPAVTITDETNGDASSTAARDDDDEDVDVGPSANTAAALAQAADVDTSDPEESDTEDAPTTGGGVARPTKRARKENPLVQSTRQKLSKEHDLTIRSDRSAAPDLRSASAQITQTVERPDYKRDPSKPKWSGPQKPQASNVRMISRMDYEPNVCKDYKETGRCGYGDSCVFLHDRGVYKQSWQLDADWNAAQEAKRKRALLGITEEEEEAAKAAASEEGQMPWACEICRQPFRTPVVTKCNHYFCESCPLFSTPIKLADGSTRVAESLKIGEKLLGQDGTTVIVTSNDLHDGAGKPLVTHDAYSVTVQGCAPFYVTGDHLMTISWRVDQHAPVPQPAVGDLAEIKVSDLAARKGELWKKVQRNAAGEFQQFTHRAMARLAPMPTLAATAAHPPQTLRVTSEATLAAFAAAAEAAADLKQGAVCYRFNQRVSHTAGGYTYAPLQPGDAHKIFVVLHQPLVADSLMDAKGNVAFTIRQLEAAWDALGIHGAGCVISETMPLCAPTDTVKADDPKFREVTTQVMRAQIASGVRTFVVCGEPAQRLWQEAHKLVPEIERLADGTAVVGGKYTTPYLRFRFPAATRTPVEPTSFEAMAAEQRKAKRLEREEKAARNEAKQRGVAYKSPPPPPHEEIRVFVAPHPAYWQRFSQLGLALLGAHERAYGVSVAIPSNFAEVARVVVPIEDVAQLPAKPEGYRYARLNVMALEPTGTEADHRYVIANGVLTHNCALNAYAKDTRCAVCRQQTAGIFNTATKLIAVLKQRQAVGFDPRTEIEKREAARKAEKEQKLAIAKATGSEWSLPGRTAGL